MYGSGYQSVYTYGGGLPPVLPSFLGRLLAAPAPAPAPPPCCICSGLDSAVMLPLSLTLGLAPVDSLCQGGRLRASAGLTHLGPATAAGDEFGDASDPREEPVGAGDAVIGPQP